MHGTKLRNVVIFGDIFLIFLFPFLGGASHASSVTVEGFTRNFVPFALTWLIVGAIGGAFKLGTIRSFRLAYTRLPALLAASGLIAVILRIVVFDRPFSFTFTIIAIAVTTLLITIWRIVIASIPGR